MIKNMSLLAILDLLSWEAKDQLLCLPDLAKDTGSFGFSFDLDNPVLRIAKIIEDFHYQREGETVLMWRERQNLGDFLEEKIQREQDEVLEGLCVVFDLMRRSSKESLFTAHGVENSAAWRLIRRVARQSQHILPEHPTIAKTAVISLLKTYKFDT